MRKEGGEAEAKTNRRGGHQAKKLKTNAKEPDKERTNGRKEETSRESRRSPDIELEFYAAQSLQQSMGSRNTLTRNYLPLPPFHLSFLGNIRERKNRLLAKPLRGAAAAASGLWQEGDYKSQPSAARSRKPRGHLSAPTPWLNLQRFSGLLAH